jgi:hypothetical protein
MTNKYMFNILCHKRNANQNYTEIPSHTSQINYGQNQTAKMLARCGEKKHSYTVGGNVN